MALSTASLDVIADGLRARGWHEARIARTVYRPFIVEGPASWVDTWHAPRYAGGFHLHEGQDVFCRYGAPVLAIGSGTIRFGVNTLGGNAAYLDLPGGGFAYYAHLSAWNDSLAAGQPVEAGDVIGYCGNSGDAIFSPPHVHFGWYDSGGVAIDPMDRLIRWLHQAEHRVAPEAVDASPAAVPEKHDGAVDRAASVTVWPASDLVQEPPMPAPAPIDRIVDALSLAAAMVIPAIGIGHRRRALRVLRRFFAGPR